MRVAVLVLVALSACTTERRVMLLDETCVARAPDGAARVLVFGDWYVARGSRTALWGWSSDELELVANGAVYGRVSSDCVGTELPEGEVRFVGVVGAEVYTAPNRATIARRLEPLTEVTLIRDAGEVALIGADGVTVGFVRTVMLTRERRVLGEVALDLHWLIERGQRLRAAEQLALLGPEALAAADVHETACHVAYSGLTDPAWVTRLRAEECPNRPRLGDIEAAAGVALLECPSGAGRVVSQTSSMSTVWACVGQSASARVYVADLDGHIAPLGEAIVPLVGTCPTARIVGVHPVGLGACIEAVASDMNCEGATDTMQRALYCLAPPLPRPPKKHAGATEILTAFKRLEREVLGDEDCLAPLDALSGKPNHGHGNLDNGRCVVTRERSGALASHHIVRIDGDYVLCVRGAHGEAGPRDLAFRLLPGRIHELGAWPGSCNTDDPDPARTGSE